MTEYQGDFIIVSCLDEIERGVVTRLPRHVTLLPWFSLSVGELPSLKHELRGVSGRHSAPVVEGGKEQWFGPNEDVLVREAIDRAGSLNGLHLDLLNSVIATRGILKSMDYAGAHYHPHVSKQQDGWINAGEKIRLSTFQLVEAVQLPSGSKREVLKNYEISG